MPNNPQFQDETASLLGNENPSFFASTRLDNTSFALSPDRLIAQAILPEQFNIRLHEPSVCFLNSVWKLFVGNYSTVVRRG